MGHGRRRVMEHWSEERSRARNESTQRQAEDVKLQQSINAAHRTAFVEKFPGQLEHILRLLAERLHAGLDKRSGVDLGDAATWRMSPGELADMAEAIYHIQQVRISLDAST